jgi:hypothetical protein
MLLNLVLRVEPIALTVAMITTEIPAAINPYSIAVAPDSSLRNAKTFDICRLIVMFMRHHDTGGQLGENALCAWKLIQIVTKNFRARHHWLDDAQARACPLWVKSRDVQCTRRCLPGANSGHSPARNRRGQRWLGFDPGEFGQSNKIRYVTDLQLFHHPTAMHLDGLFHCT